LSLAVIDFFKENFLQRILFYLFMISFCQINKLTMNARGQHHNIEHIPIEGWVSMAAEGTAKYKTTPLSAKEKAEFIKKAK